MEQKKVQSYKDLIVWQKAKNLDVEIYAITEKFPQQELYVLTSQMRRAAVPIPSNIAEGRRRGTRKDYRQFLLIAYGSGSELETQIEIAKRLSLGKSADFSQADLHLDEVMRMLNVMVHKLGSQPTS